jgi:hypothetical protein
MALVEQRKVHDTRARRNPQAQGAGDAPEEILAENLRRPAFRRRRDDPAEAGGEELERVWAMAGRRSSARVRKRPLVWDLGSRPPSSVLSYVRL